MENNKVVLTKSSTRQDIKNFKECFHSDMFGVYNFKISLMYGPNSVDTECVIFPGENPYKEIMSLIKKKSPYMVSQGSTWLGEGVSTSDYVYDHSDEIDSGKRTEEEVKEEFYEMCEGNYKYLSWEVYQPEDFEEGEDFEDFED